MTSFFESVLRISAEAAVLALLVLGARLIVGRRPGAMLTVLYALIAVRLIVPAAISSPLSVHNLWNEPQTQLAEVFDDTQPGSADGVQTPLLADTDEAQKPVSESASATQKPQSAIVSDNLGMPSAAQTRASAVPLSALDIATLIWAAGMIAFSGVMLTGNALFMRRIRRNRKYDTPEFMALLNECRQSLGLKRNVRAICASETGTAAVYGVFRPVLLISPASFETLTDAQKRHVLLHELAHIRRGDTLICAGATVLNILHWFNPIMWIVFALMRRDIEVQCDAHVFRGLPGSERGDYARTLLKLAGPVQTPTLAPALFISKANIKRRIVMVVKHRRKSVLFSAVAVLLTVLVAITGCTTAVDVTPVSTSAVVDAAPKATPAPIPSDYKLLGSYTFDYSACADDTARVSNIKKAAALLDGIEFTFDTQLILSDKLMPLTVENGWLNAPWTSWEITAMESSNEGMKTVVESVKSSEDRQVGGGIELVMLAIRIAADDIGLSYQSSWSDDGSNLITEGSFDLKNESHSDVILSISAENNAVTASFYGTEKPAEALAKPVLMSSFTIDNSPPPHNRDSRMTNIQIAADIINGTVIKPGETFSLNDALGPRNEETAKTVGWTLGSGIKDGSYTSNIGGGITAVSTALYNAAIRAELNVVDITHCAIPYDLVDGGLDATVSTDGPDLKISNPYSRDVTIEAKLEGLILTVSFYGPRMHYTVDFGSSRIQATELPETEYYYNATTTPDGTEIPPGQSVKYRAPRSGITCNVYKTRYDLDGNKIDSVIFEEVTYRGYTGQVYVNGPDPATASSESDFKVKTTPTPVPTSAPSAAVPDAKK